MLFFLSVLSLLFSPFMDLHCMSNSFDANSPLALETAEGLSGLPDMAAPKLFPSFLTCSCALFLFPRFLFETIFYSSNNQELIMRHGFELVAGC